MRTLADQPGPTAHDDVESESATFDLGMYRSIQRLVSLRNALSIQQQFLAIFLYSNVTIG
jgi:hypothetical protein